MRAIAGMRVIRGQHQPANGRIAHSAAVRTSSIKDQKRRGNDRSGNWCGNEAYAALNRVPVRPAVVSIEGDLSRRQRSTVALVKRTRVAHGIDMVFTSIHCDRPDLGRCRLAEYG